MENSTDSRTGRLRYVHSTYNNILLKLSEMLEKAYIPRRSEFGALYTHVIPAQCSNDACIYALYIMLTVHVEQIVQPGFDEIINYAY